MTSVALLCHRFGNIGHNFMALGAEVAARRAFGPLVRIDHFEQHHPFSIYPAGDWLRLIDKTAHHRFGWMRRRMAREDVYTRLWRRTRPLDFDLAVACGGPNLVAGASGSHAAPLQILLLHLNGAFHYRGVPLIDAAVGSAFALSRIPDRLDPDDEAFYRKALQYVSLLTVREPQAQRIFAQLGVTPPVHPCMAIGSGHVFEAERAQADAPDRNGYVVVNFQAKGSNDDWGQGVNPHRWMEQVRGVIADLEAKGERILLLCHSAYEQRLAKQLAPHLPIKFPQSEPEYARLIANAKIGFVSRIHAAIALAGIGVPSVVVGNDTRTGTTAEMGLTSLFTMDTGREQIVTALEETMGRLDEERDRLLALREDTMDKYAELFAGQARRQS